MEDILFKKLSTIDVVTLIALIIFIVLTLNIVTPWIKKFKDHIIKKNNKEIKEETIENIVYETEERVSKYEQNRINDREQSRKIQKELVDAINNLNAKLDKMTQDTDKRFKESLARENKRSRAELKDRIGESYRLYHSLGKWNFMEKEALEDLIKEYEDAGGINSFVHDVVQKEMYTWELVDHK